MSSYSNTSNRPEEAMDYLRELRVTMSGEPTSASSEGCMEADWRGLTARPIFTAANRGDVQELKRLLKDPEMRQRVNDLDGDKCGILHSYCLNAKGDDPGGIVNAVIDAGGDVNLRSVVQETPLQIAVLYSQVRVVRALLDRGARIDLADWKGDASVPTARKKCKHNGDRNERCCQVLQMLLEAESRLKADGSIQQQADRLRTSGNKAFQNGEYEKARDLYTQSIDVIEDYRAFSNRALCNIELGKLIIRKEWRNRRYTNETRNLGREAMLDAGKACTLEPTFAKAHYRKALGHAMARDFPRAKNNLKKGLEQCPENEALKMMLNELDYLEVPEHIGIPGDRQEEINRLVESGVPCVPCIFCRCKLPLSEEYSHCPYCTMDPDPRNVEEQDLIDFILNH